MSAIGKNDERLLGKLLVSTALVVISAAYGYWQKTLEAPRAPPSIAAMPSPMPAQTATAAPARGVTANDAAAPVTADAAASDASADANARTALADAPAAAKPAAAPVAAAPAAPYVPAPHVYNEGPAATAVTMPGGSHLEDGEYTSQKENFEWGTIQVKAVIKDGAFSDIQFLQMPDHRPHSEELSEMSRPILTHEAIHDQKSLVDVVSTATYTSMAYQDAMADVIMRASRQ